jgi:uncharacterized protein DUF6285
VNDIPDAEDLIATARDALLADVLPALSAQHRYTALMIANAMAIAAREQHLGPEATRSEAARLQALLVERNVEMPPSGDLHALRRAVAVAIRGGRFDAKTSGQALTDALVATSQAWVAISNPKALRPPHAAGGKVE